MEETSLDRFVSDETSDSVSEGEDDAESTATDGTEPTLSYTPEGAPCEDCGREVGRRWHTEAGPRCEQCLVW